MTKRTTSKFKLDRRMGENIWGRNKSPISKRAYGPGQHGQRKSRKLSDYGTQLRAKQKLKGYYGDVTEKQFKRTYVEASRMKGDASQNLIGPLERRLDMFVYRAKFAPTIWAARQLVSHAAITVNGEKVTIASYQCKAGDVVGLREKTRKQARIQQALQIRSQIGFPDWVEVDEKKFSGVLKSLPEREDILPDINESLVVELYSK